MPLSLPPADNGVLISCDASDFAIGGVIWEEYDLCEHNGTPLNLSDLSVSSAGFSPIPKRIGQRCRRALRYTSYPNRIMHRELFQKNLSYLVTVPDKNRIVTRWLPILSEFDFELVHTSGENNYWADILSRQVPTTDPVRINTSNAHFLASEITYERFHPIYYIRNYNPSDDSALPDSNNLRDTHQILILKEKCASAIPMIDPWLSRIRSEQRQAVAAHERSFNNCSVNHLDLYLNKSGKIIIPSLLINDTLLIIHGYVSGGVCLSVYAGYPLPTTTGPNLITGVETKASISQCKLYHSDKPTDDEFHRIVASGDTEEHLLLKVLSQDGNECQVVYAGDVRGTEPVDRIKSTKAYQAFLQTNKSRPPAGQPTRKQPRRRAKRDSRKEGKK
ncbi:hypothetical protein P9112_004496 [Eukaryota sp. TZLM1-RC]